MIDDLVDIVQLVGVIAFWALNLLALLALPWFWRRALRCPGCGSRIWVRRRIERRWTEHRLGQLVIGVELEPVEVVDCGRCELWASRPG